MSLCAVSFKSSPSTTGKKEHYQSSAVPAEKCISVQNISCSIITGTAPASSSTALTHTHMSGRFVPPPQIDVDDTSGHVADVHVYNDGKDGKLLSHVQVAFVFSSLSPPSMFSSSWCVCDCPSLPGWIHKYHYHLRPSSGPAWYILVWFFWIPFLSPVPLCLSSPAVACECVHRHLICPVFFLTPAHTGISLTFLHFTHFCNKLSVCTLHRNRRCQFPPWRKYFCGWKYLQTSIVHEEKAVLPITEEAKMCSKHINKLY